MIIYVFILGLGPCVSPKFIELFMETLCLCSLVGHEHGANMGFGSETKYCYNYFRAPLN